MGVDAMRKGFTVIELMIVIAIICILAAIVVGGLSDHKKQDIFMSECRQDHKEYECETMWGQSHPQAQVTYVWVH